MGIFALGDIHALKGKQKSGKSSVLKVCTAALLTGQQFRVKSELDEPVVLFVDTEQQEADVKLVIDELKNMSQCSDEYINQYLFLYSLRSRSYDTLLGDTRLLIERHHPHIVFIDGLVDYVESFNDEKMSRTLIHKLLLLCNHYHCAIVNVLHENKGTDDANMRGHLGTVLGQKAGTVLQCQKSKSGIISVTCPDSRHGVMPQWSICYDDNGHIINADLLKLQQEQAAREQRAAVKQAEREVVLQTRLDVAKDIINDNGGSMLRNELTKRMEERMSLSRPVISKFLSLMMKDGKLFETRKIISLPSLSHAS